MKLRPVKAPEKEREKEEEKAAKETEINGREKEDEKEEKNRGWISRFLSAQRFAHFLLCVGRKETPGRFASAVFVCIVFLRFSPLIFTNSVPK